MSLQDQNRDLRKQISDLKTGFAAWVERAQPLARDLMAYREVLDKLLLAHPELGSEVDELTGAAREKYKDINTAPALKLTQPEEILPDPAPATPQEQAG